jgi:hypothetical protein
MHLRRPPKGPVDSSMTSKDVLPPEYDGACDAARSIDITDQGCTTKVLAITKAFGFVTNYKGLGPAYSFSINPKGLIKGQSYYLLVQTGSDPIWHTIQFTA